MNETELPSLADSSRLFLIGAPFLLLALRSVNAFLPRQPAPAHRWTWDRTLYVCLTPFALSQLLAALLPAPGVFASLLLSQLVFGLTGLLIVLLAARSSQGLASLGLASGVAPRAFLAAPIVCVPWFFAAGGLGAAWLHLCRKLGWEEEQEVLRVILSLARRELLLALVVAVFLGPFLEELLFRGFFQSALSQVAGQRGALFITSAIFALLHGTAGLPVLFLVSLFFGWLQQRTRCLLVPWSAHALHNGIQLGLALALKDHAG